MKVIKSTKEASTYPKQIDCDGCESVLEYDVSDVQTGAFGIAYVSCPECGAKTNIDDWESNKDLTIENLSFPNDYSFFGDGAKKLTDDEINKYVKECLEKLKEDKEDYGTFRHTGTGDSVIFVIKYEDEYVIYVCKNYYEVSISRDGEE